MIWRALGRGMALALVVLLAWQLYFLARVVSMRIVDPASTAFERSEAWRLARARGPAIGWRQQWLPYARISPNLKRAVIASEDAGFVVHAGVEWDALERAWERNRKAEARVERQPTRPGQGSGQGQAAKLVGGSTITQQLAKNLFLGGERTLARKAQEFAIALMLEACLDKRRILEIYLNHVEWGEGVFGAEAAARRYFGVGADALTPAQAARLAVMLPAPKRFEQRPGSAYVQGRSAVVLARMGTVEVP